MNRFSTTHAYALLPLLAAGCLLLASCEASFEEQDRTFCQAMQHRLSGEFQKQVTLLSEAEKKLAGAGEGVEIPDGFQPWWNQEVQTKLFEDSKPANQPLDDLLARALVRSSQIKVFGDLPLIRETGIQEARGEFDTHLFVDTAYEYIDEPVDTTLRTGGPKRFKQWQHRLEAGLRKKLYTGADVTLSQWLARTSNNSVYFDPDHQASAVLSLTVVQPLLRLGGVKYNRSLIRIAKLDSEIARNEFIRQAESHLLQIARAYWNLYLSRALCVQKRKLLQDTAAVAAKLEKRQDEATKGDLMHAKAVLGKRRAELVRAEMAVKNTEDRIKALINDPSLLPSASTELVPVNAPSLRELKVDMKQAAAAALENRPEIQQAFLQLKTAAIRKNMSKNELLPQLDLILRTSIAGMDKAGRITDGWDNMWRDAHPGFLVGLRFDYPLENNAAKARLRRRRIEIRQQLAQIQTTVDTVLLEVKISAREVATSYRELRTRYESLLAAQEDLRILQKRWESNLGAGTKPAIGYLQLLMDSQDRLAEAQETFARDLAIYNFATLNLQRAQGTLLKYEDLRVVRTEDDSGLPKLHLQKAAAPPVPAPTPTPAPAAVPAGKGPAKG